MVDASSTNMNPGTVAATTTPLGMGGVGEVPGMNVVGLSPEMLLEYCGSMLNGLNGQIDTLMSQQQAQINEQQVLGNLQSALGQITSPPASQSDMNACVSAYQTAINALPPGDPVATQLQAQLSSFEQQYGAGANTITAAGLKSALPDVLDGNVGNVVSDTVKNSATHPSSTQWQAITGQVQTTASTIKSGAQIQFLTLQDLCSQQQDAVEQVTNMMTKENETLLDQAKAIGA